LTRGQINKNPKAQRATKIAKALGIGRASVYRVLEGG
jgi:DNA-binding IclR family transcriptional regulator